VNEDDTENQVMSQTNVKDRQLKNGTMHF